MAGRWWWLAIAPGCTPASPAVDTAPPAPSVVVAPDPADSAPRDRAAPQTAAPAVPAGLVKAAVTPENAARRALFTWTTSEQLGLLRKHRRLLFRKRGSDGSRSLYEVVIEDVDDPVTRMLRGDAFTHKRFAWANPWGTALGWGPGARYGDVMVRVVLKPEAVIAFMKVEAEAGSIQWRFATASGQPVTESEALANPERVAAVFHESVEDEDAYREYVLVNESMIASWEVATPGLAATLRSQAAELEGWAAAVGQAPTRPPWWSTLTTAWREVGPSALSHYAATLALAADHYRPEALPKLASALRAAADIDGPELVVSPRVGFGAPIPAALKPKPKPIPRCADPTFCR